MPWGGWGAAQMVVVVVVVMMMVVVALHGPGCWCSRSRVARWSWWRLGVAACPPPPPPLAAEPRALERHQPRRDEAPPSHDLRRHTEMMWSHPCTRTRNDSEAELRSWI